jgi:hypothetical protein
MSSAVIKWRPTIMRADQALAFAQRRPTVFVWVRTVWLMLDSTSAWENGTGRSRVRDVHFGHQVTGRRVGDGSAPGATASVGHLSREVRRE